ncbi:MAG: putative sulfate exporter family transporter, partial [Rhodospirillales bacterium]|nr:putative sulfate exporter family transporter [Rhodospirillales bacterium]
LGVKTSLKSLAQVGTIPIVMMVSQTAFLALWIIGGTWILGMG